MKVRLTGSIAVKLTLLVLGVTSLVFAGVLFYSYRSSRAIILAEAEKSARNLSQSVARRIEQDFRAVAKVPESLAYFLEVRPCRSEQTLKELIRKMVAENREIFGSTVAYAPYMFDARYRLFAPYFYKDKRKIEYAQLGSAEYDYPRKDWYHIPDVLQAPVWSQPYFDEGGGNIIMITYSVPFFEYSPDGSKTALRGVVTADVSLGWLTELTSSLRLGETGRCFLISDRGTFVTAQRRNLIMRESIFSLAEDQGDRKLRRIGRAMIREDSGFVDLGSSYTGAPSFLAFARIPSIGWAVGAIFPKEELFAEVSKLHRNTVVLAVVGALALLSASVLVAKSIARPLRRMADATEKVARGDLEVDLSDVRSRDEVGQLARAFTRMTEGLKERDFIRDTFGRYLTREVVERLLESEDGLKLGGENREISMLMSDLRGFTALTSTMHAEQVIAFLNRYLGKMLEILIDHRGTVDEIIGDGILAFFGAPEAVEDHPARAVACALAMQAAMDEINAVNEAEGLPHLEMGVAVNTGHVVVGNIGSERRAKYGAVGSQVNFTGRVESFTVGGQVLISQSAYERIDDMLDVREVLHVEMKGIPGSVALYDVRAIRGKYNVHLPERDSSPLPLKHRIHIKLQRLDEKVVAGAETFAEITHSSMTSAIIALSHGIRQWENIKMLIVGPDGESAVGEVYGKVVSVTGSEAQCEALVRFTSASPQAYKIFREASSAG